MSEEFRQWCMSFNDWRRIILYKHSPYPKIGYIIAWDDPSLDNINKENWS